MMFCRIPEISKNVPRQQCVPMRSSYWYSI